ncbi:apoptosis facilitator Bcl-2-like protein 14 isoform X2 [Myripristis murdjan]|nr:apoptosis facilitator Bcl-2-like protein 14 isoform X2 [Myripristis murdjan]
MLCRCYCGESADSLTEGKEESQLQTSSFHLQKLTTKMSSGQGVPSLNGTHNNNNGDLTHASDPERMNDSVEFRLMMAYAQRRRPGGDNSSSTRDTPDENATSLPRTPAETEKEVKREGKKKKKGRSLKKLFSCVRRQAEEPEDVNATGLCFRSASNSGDQEGAELTKLANRLIKLADEVPFTPSDIETDSVEDSVEKLVGMLLREQGDRLNQEVLREVPNIGELFRNYSFFEKLISLFLRRMGFKTFEPDGLGPQGSPKTQIALTCEVTSRLSAVNTLPMNRLLGFGANYLHTHYSAWVAQQGGYDAAIEDEEEEEVH